MARRLVVLGVAALCILAVAGINFAQRQTPAPTRTAPVTPRLAATAAARPGSEGMPLEAQQALVKQYCSGCHNEKLKSGNMSLTELDLAHTEKNPELAERVIRKVRVGLMPPVGNARPEPATMKSFVT